MEEYRYAFSYVLILISLFIASRENLGNERDIFLSSLRTAVQLIALGFILRYILSLKELWEIFAVIGLMVIFASVIAYERIRRKEILLFSFLSILITSFSSTLFLLFTGILKPDPYHIIPFGGLIVGNTLNSITLAADRFLAEVKNRISEIEAKIALGSSLRLAMSEAFRESLRASLIPKINFMKSAGIVHIPGVAVGMLMAGSDPMEAILYQIVILYSLVFAGTVGSVILLYLLYRRAFYIIFG